jgi:hypothetical protein
LDRDEGSAIDDEEDQEQELGPVPRDAPGPFAGAGVDEVEAAYGYVSPPLVVKNISTQDAL